MAEISKNLSTAHAEIEFHLVQVGKRLKAAREEYRRNGSGAVERFEELESDARELLRWIDRAASLEQARDVKGAK